MVAEQREHRFQETRQVALVGAGVNLLLSVVKIVVGVIGHSEALVADGIHSLSDLASDALVYFASRHARHAPDEEHPYGHGRFETAATLGLGGLLILVSAGIVWDAVERMFRPEELLQPDAIALYAAVFSILANEWLYHYTLRVGRRIGSNMLLANAWHHRSDALSSVIVFVGVLGTIAGLPYLDAIAAVAVGVMIARIGWDLGWTAIQELVDSGLEEEKLDTIRNTILSVGGVRDIHMLRTRRLGGVASADVHVQVEPRLSVSEGHMIALTVEQRLKEEVEEIDDVTVHIDPEDDRDAPSCMGLPLRARALEMLARAWEEEPQTEHATNIVLHYLGGRIDVDIYLPLGRFKGEAQSKALRERLQARLTSLSEFGAVRVFYG
ncbi:MAG TPA: cation transporter [Chromatiales bacterium]|nr:cation transporter [Chromatiales bacterium]